MKIYYFTPDFDWETAESKSGIGYWRDVDASNVKSVIKGQRDCVVVYDSVDDFIEAFNSEEISDMGFAVAIKKA